MEYDRALFRVYERILEDLNGTPSPMALASSTDVGATGSSVVSSPRRGGLRRRRHQEMGSPSSGDSEESEGADHGSPESQRSAHSEGSSLSRGRRRRRMPPRAPVMARRQFSSGLQQQGRREQLPLPFILPIWMARKLERINHSLDDTRLAMGGPNSNSVARIWGIIRSGFRDRQQYDSVATSPLTPSRSRALSPGGSNHRDDTDEENSLHDVDEDIEAGLQLTPINTADDSGSSSEGLRRRSPARRRQSPPSSSPTHQQSTALGSPRRSSPPSIPSSSSGGLGQGAVLQPRVSSPTSAEETPNNGSAARSSAPAGSLAQRAIQMQLRQSERLSSHGGRRRRRESERVSDAESSSDASGDEYDTDDTSSSSSSSDTNDRRNARISIEGGCSQRNLYGVMRLSFAVAVLHLFVLASLHVTYVGPGAFRSEMGLAESAKKRRRRRLGRGLFVGDVADENEAQQKEASAPNLVNCVAYALSTRPIEARSTYFGEEKDDKESSSSPKEDDETTETPTGTRSLEDPSADDFVSPGRETRDYDDDELYDRRPGDVPYPRFGNAVVRPLVVRDDEYVPQRAMAADNGKGAETPLLGKDEILQIKILYGGKCSGRCSRVRNVVYPPPEEGNSNSTDTAEPSLDQAGLRGLQSNPRERQSKETGEEEKRGNATATKEDELSSPSYWEKVHYRFAVDDALLFLDETSAKMHNITVVNVTVTERCLSTGTDDGELTFLTATGQFLSQIYGMDSVIINQLMYGIRGIDGAFTPGYVKNMDTSERWGWHKEQLEAFEHASFPEWVFRKLGVVVMSTLAFFLITSVTSLIVRVLTSSGVVLMFPLFACFRAAGMPGADERILALSYPWIGSARAAIRERSVHPQSHLVWAHVTKIVLYYVMYEACQAAWSVVLYAKSIPEALPIWIYGFAMIWEYFSMVFVRSALSVHFFPRIVFLYFCIYHAYFYSVPYGYFDVALIPLFLFVVHAMLYTILGLEAPNSARGVINVENPREVYNKLSWQEPVAALPPEWTIFLPLNARLSPLHDREVANGAQNNGSREGEIGGAANENGGDASA